jgi:uncharacterized membrane protein
MEFQKELKSLKMQISKKWSNGKQNSEQLKEIEELQKEFIKHSFSILIEYKNLGKLPKFNPQIPVPTQH